MQNEETTVETQDATQEGQTADVEETSTEEATEESQSETEEATPEAKLAHAEAEAAKYRRLFEKSQKPKASVAPKAPQAASPSNVEETVLLANGMPEDLLAELKAVAQVRGTTLIKAQNDPIFVAVKDKYEKEKKQAAASMPASRGSGGVKAKKTFTTPGLSREEHMEMVKSL